MRQSFYLLFLLCFPLLAGAQSAYTEVKGLPTNEVFDLLVDSKGFLWISHDMGISRFDGVAFSHFSHPQRSSLSVTDLVEDQQGRIWFHNFTGQVFYIENERIHLLEAYKYENETNYPRLVRCGGEIVVSSSKGLFICDTRTMKSRYVQLRQPEKYGIRSLTAIGDKVLGLGVEEWYLYDAKSGLRKIPMQGKNIFLTNKSFMLQPKAYKDTGFLISNPKGTVYKIVLKGDQVQIAGMIQPKSFINSVYPEDEYYWVHSKLYSGRWTSGRQAEKIEGYNISDIVVDKQKNTWISSLSKGLLVRPNQQYIQSFSLPFLEKSDLVMAIDAKEDTLFIGTQQGYLYQYHLNSKTLLWKYKIPTNVGSINLITPEVNGIRIICTSSESFFLYPQSKRVETFIGTTIKDVVVKNNRALVASAAGLLSLPYLPSPKSSFDRNTLNLQQWNSEWRKFISGNKIYREFEYDWYEPRSRSIALPAGSQELYVSFMNGVHVFGQEGAAPMIFEGRKVYSNSMVSHEDKLYIGTLNNGLLIKKGQRIKTIKSDDHLFSNSIVKLRKEGNYIWILQDRGIQLLDIRTDKIIHDIKLPLEPGSGVYDVVQIGDTAILATHSGMYKVLMKPSDDYNQLKSYIKLAVVNRKDTLQSTQVKLAYNQRDIQFFLSIPWYNPSNSVYFKYRLKGAASDNDQWYITQPGERSILFASLMPGEYTFESYAVVAGFQEKVPNTFSFTIKKPWWLTNLFFVTVFVGAGLLFWGLYRLRVRQVMKLDQVRRTISSDLHDEIGSTISSINIYSEIARNEKDNKEYLDLIQENTREVISKLDDLVWSINPKNDSVAQLVSRMRSFAEPVLKGAGIYCTFEVNEHLLQQELPLETKRNLYLIFKELVNNVIKHSKATHCSIKIELVNSQISLLVADNGIGINFSKQPTERQGMQNLASRTRRMKAFLFFKDNEGTGTAVRVMVPVRLT